MYMLSGLMCLLMLNSRVLVPRQGIWQQFVFKAQSSLNSICWNSAPSWAGDCTGMGLPGKRNQLHVVLGQGSRAVTVKPCDLETQAAPPWEGSAVPVAAYLGRCSFTLFACKVLPIPEREPLLRRLGVKAEFDPPSPMLCSALCSFQNRVLD